MGMYHEIILTASSLEDIGNSENPEQYVAVDAVNDWLRSNGGFDLWLINNGNKIVPDSCFVGSFKGLNRDRFIEAVRAAPWQWRDMVQLFIRWEADDRGFQEIPLWK